jgi:hypothetical protein
MARRQTYVGKPRLLHQVIEARALLEMAALPWNLPMLARTPRGDGHPVLLLPGFMADEGTLIVLKLFLQNRGYEATQTLRNTTTASPVDSSVAPHSGAGTSASQMR